MLPPGCASSATIAAFLPLCLLVATLTDSICDPTGGHLYYPCFTVGMFLYYLGICITAMDKPITATIANSSASRVVYPL